MLRNEEMEAALKRHEMIAPLLVPGLDDAEKRRIRREVLDREAISERTLRRYIAAYHEKSYEGLLPKTRDDVGRIRSIFQEVLDRAAELRQELPERSVRRIVCKLEGEGTVIKGELSRSTLSRHLLNMGFGASELRNTKITGNAAG
jgi:hypothetical protein